MIDEASKNKNRLNEIKVRLNDDEFAQVKINAARVPTARWLRELAVNQTPPPQPKPIDNRLLRQIAGMGANLNQLAKHANQLAATNQPIPAIKILAELSVIRYQLDELLKQNYDS